MEIYNVEKQLILYTKYHFGELNYDRDLKYFAMNLYGLEEEYVTGRTTYNMVLSLYMQLVEYKLIKLKLDNFLDNLLMRSFHEKDSVAIDHRVIVNQMLSEIQNMRVEGTGLDLGEPDFRLLEGIVS